MSVIKPIGDTKYEKKRPKNPKYSDVSPLINSGVNTNILNTIKSNEISIKKKHGELFIRMSSPKLASLLISKEMTTEDGPSTLTEANVSNYLPNEVPMHKVIIVDVRDKESYNKCKIKTAIHYPAELLSRSMHYFTPQLQKVINNEECCVVLYDLDEEITVGRKVGNIFFEKGFDRIFILAGGLRDFVQEHSDLVDGEPPVEIIPKPKMLHYSRRTLKSNLQFQSIKEQSSVATTHKPKSLANSLSKSSVFTWR